MFEDAAQSSRRAAARVLIADDHVLYVQAVTAMLAADERIEVVGSASDGAEAVELALALRPDVILMDIDMPALNGIEATLRIRRRLPRTHVLVVTSSTEPEDVERARRAGAAGYLTKQCSGEDLAAAIVQSSRGAAPRAASHLWSVAC